MKWFKKLASGAMAAAMVMLCAPTVVNATALPEVTVSQINFSGVSTSLASAIAGKAPQFKASVDTVSADPSDGITDTYKSNFIESWINVTTYTGTSSKNVKSNFKFEAGQTYIYYAGTTIEYPEGNAFWCEHNLTKDSDTYYSRALNTNNDGINVSADGNDLPLITSVFNPTTLFNTATTTLTGYAEIRSSDKASTETYTAGNAQLMVGYYKKITIPPVTLDTVNFSGVSTSLASVKAGSAPTFAASIDNVNATPSDGIAPSYKSNFEEDWIDPETKASTSSGNIDSDFKFVAGKKYIYYAGTSINTPDKYAFWCEHDLEEEEQTNSYSRVLDSIQDTFTVNADGKELPLTTFGWSMKWLLSAATPTLTGFAQVRKYSETDPADYSGEATLMVGYIVSVTVPELVPSATVTDIDVKGTVGTPIDPVEFTINATDMKFVAASDMAKWAAVEGNSFDNCINLPKGLELSYVDSDDSFATFKISGTPTEAVSKSFEITIPWELTYGKNDVTVTANTNAKWDITDVKKEEPIPTETKDPNYVYRLYNSNSGEHFYTTSAYERDYIMTAGWDYEGKAWVAPESGTPVIRMYNPVAGEHHYTTSQEEAAALVEAGWNLESDCAFYSAEAETGQPIYRLYNPNAFANNHHFTSSEEEVSFLEDAGWNFEGTAFYGVK